jgi:hypothetical protein
VGPHPFPFCPINHTDAAPTLLLRSLALVDNVIEAIAYIFGDHIDIRMSGKA